MSGVIDNIERAQLRRVPVFQAGDRVRVHFQVVEGTRKRTQVFEGIVLKRQGSGARETFSVRKQSFGVGVERTFPLHSPKIERIEVAGRGDVRRAKLYYLRDRVGRSARVRERRFGGREEDVYAEGTMPPPEADAPEVVAADGEEGDAEVEPVADPRDEGADAIPTEDEDENEEAAAEAAQETPSAEEAAEPEEEAGPEDAEAEPAEEPRA
jgi:large subunit ribosomal protein L19